MSKAAAFYDLEGTLVRTNLVHTLAFYSLNQPGLLRSVGKAAATAASVPLFVAAELYSRKVFNNIYFRHYKGQLRERLLFLADELYEKVLEPGIFPGSRELIEKSRQMGLRQVLVTGALDFTIERFVEQMGFDDYVANRLEFVGGVATGRLLPPVMASATKASWMRTYAEREGLNLSDSYGYSDSMSDLPMLSMVGHPAAVNPDLRLKATALRHDWPILDLS
jgi:HAD superfamily hydrolase (TIGR01490 family)